MTMNEENKQAKPYYTVQCPVCKKYTNFLDDREDGVIDCLHCDREIDIAENTRADSKPEADILTTALDVAIAQRNDLNAEVEMLKADLRTERDHGIDTGCKISELEAEVERLEARIHQMQNEEVEAMHDIVAQRDEYKRGLDVANTILESIAKGNIHAKYLAKSTNRNRRIT